MRTTKLGEILDDLEKIVVPEGVDSGLILLSSDSPCTEDDDGVTCYLHEHFSPLGDALVALHRKIKELESNDAA